MSLGKLTQPSSSTNRDRTKRHELILALFNHSDPALPSSSARCCNPGSYQCRLWVPFLHARACLALRTSRPDRHIMSSVSLSVPFPKLIPSYIKTPFWFPITPLQSNLARHVCIMTTFVPKFLIFFVYVFVTTCHYITTACFPWRFFQSCLGNDE